MKTVIRFLLYKLLFKLIVISLIFSISKHSYALSPSDAAYWNMNRTLSGTVQEGIAKRGFATTDPRVANTLARISPALKVVAGGAAAVVAGSVSAPIWASIAIGVGVSYAIPYAIDLAIAGVKWLFRSDGLIDESGSPSTVDTSGTMTAGGEYWKSSGYPKEIAGANGEAIARQNYFDRRALPGNSYMTETPVCVVNSTTTSTTIVCGGYGIATKYTSGAPTTCPKGLFSDNGHCIGYTFPTPTSIPAQTGRTLQQAVNDLPSQDLNKELNPDLIAALVNQAWRYAAEQPGYDGLPYPASNPITGDEVSNWTKANPTLAPTVSDFVTPRPVTTASPNPWALTPTPTAPVFTPAPAPNTNTTNPGAANPIANLGPDPGIGAPSLETPPTPAEILAPILNLMPALKNFTPNTQAGTCPTLSFQIFGNTVTSSAHCTLIESNKSIMQAAMSFAWAVMAMFIILSA
jgi:hypothetical protein